MSLPLKRAHSSGRGDVTKTTPRPHDAAFGGIQKRKSSGAEDARPSGRKISANKEREKKKINNKKTISNCKESPARLSPVLYRAGEIVAPAPFLAILCALIRDIKKQK